MIILLKGGVSVWVRAAKSYKQSPAEFMPTRRAGKVLAVFARSEIVAWFWDSEYITTYGFAEKADVR